MQFLDLPVEIIQRISLSLNQHELFQFAYTSKALYQIVQPRFYYCITVDASKTVFTNKKSVHSQYSNFTIVPSYSNARGIQVNAVNISTLYSLKQFFKTILEKPQYCSFIRYLSFHEKIPDIPDVVFYGYLSKLVGRLTNIRSFQWFNNCYSLPIELILKLNSSYGLVELSGNMNLMNMRSDLLFSFKELKHLHISQFVDANYLKELDLSQFPFLDELVLSKGACGNSDFQFYKNNDEIDYTNIDFSGYNDCIINLFHGYNSNKKLRLKSLTFKDIALTSEDAKILLYNIDFSDLRSFSILNSVELLYEQVDYHDIRRRRLRREQFLSLLAPHVCTVSNLNLNLCNELNYNNGTIGFIRSQKNLQSLNLILNFNKYENLDSNLSNVFACLDNGYTNQSLKFFNFDFTVVNSGLTTPVSGQFNKLSQLKYSSESLHLLTKLHNLNYLNLPISEEQMNVFMGILHQLRTLQCLSLNFSKCCKKQQPQLNSLIHQGYFDYPNICVEVDRQEQAFKYANDCQSASPRLKWMTFEYGNMTCGLQNDPNGKYIYECTNKKHNKFRIDQPIIHRDVGDFPVNNIIDELIDWTN
ncbi:uncharacterized protein RJT20DRAFT_132400 [Scheffersomyces xylosifermentans]|uniref:uncharacterized protein n=1 Tax=Scheffersomyces xylosifermentans TaxID=1304137 RepID=UPI00315C5351